ATAYAIWHGPAGLQAIAGRIHGLADRLASGLKAAGISVLGASRFDTATVELKGKAGAIAAAFGAPLAGAFYAFEIVIGAYTPAALAPVAVAALAGAFVADQAGIEAYLLPAASTIDVRAADYAIYGLLGCCCAMVGILVMR
ncbi:chloride channel protein, partial [Mesorhizobium sp. M1C.F.Ca.ET.212.01.1.1]|uniref:chloride channel protein n=1 Tax=Mesorhizobium sp. M1C.F.Ca.ET.212.01.1.1 TaxID=2500527 RepID=UPI001FE24242